MDLDLKKSKEKNEEKSDLKADFNISIRTGEFSKLYFQKIIFQFNWIFLAPGPIILRNFKNWSISEKFCNLDIRQ